VQGAGCRVQGAGCRVQGAGCRVQGAGCRVEGVPPSLPVKPVLQMHSVIPVEDAPIVKELAGHAIHTAGDVAAEEVE